MSPSGSEPVVAVDVGNSRFKLGMFDRDAGEAYPQPSSLLELHPDPWKGEPIIDWLNGCGVDRVSWWIASVHRGASQRIDAWLTDRRGDEGRTSLQHTNLPLSIDVEYPQDVGIDRLLAAVAVNAIRRPDRPALVVDHGSAITVDLVDSNGVFRGGAILPGIGMAAGALDRLTDRLPLVDVHGLDQPDALGRSTEAAIRSGLFWGAVGAVRELIERLSRQVPEEPQIVVTGGAGRHIAEALGDEARWEPNLILSGIALAAREM